MAEVKSVEVENFRRAVAVYLAGVEPIAVTDQGRVIGLYVPTASSHGFSEHEVNGLLAESGRLETSSASRAAVEHSRLVPAQAESPELTRRQVQILRLVATGMTNREIAAHTGLADATVKTYVHDAMRRLNAHTRTRAVATARGQGLL